MNAFYIDIALCLLVYMVMIGFIVWRNRKNKPSDDSGDDDGGIHAWTGPDLDLPPGISLPSDGPKCKEDRFEEVLA